MTNISKLVGLTNTVSPMLAMFAKDVAKLNRFAFGEAVPVEHVAAIAKANSIHHSIIINIGHKELT